MVRRAVGVPEPQAGQAAGKHVAQDLRFIRAEQEAQSWMERKL